MTLIVGDHTLWVWGCREDGGGFKIGFNTRRRCRNHQPARADAEHKINSIDRDPEFRNQQVAGSTPAGGSNFSITYEHNGTRYLLW